MNKHVKLFKQIPHGNFGVSKLFFEKTPMPKTTDDIVLAYFYISKEMLDSLDYRRFIVRKNTPPFEAYDCHDPITDIHIPIYQYKEQKLFNGVIHTYKNRTPYQEYSGLVAVSKDGTDISSDIEDFKIFAENYKSKHFSHDMFTNERRCCIGKHQINHLYELLKTLILKADFKYVQPGSIILAQEMANLMINNNIIKDNQHTPGGQDLVRQHKEFMFGEIKHDDAHFQAVKAMWRQKQK